MINRTFKLLVVLFLILYQHDLRCNHILLHNVWHWLCYINNVGLSLKSPLQTLYRRHHQIIDRCAISISQMETDLFPFT